MDEDKEAVVKIEQLAIALGQEVVNASTTIHGATKMWMAAMQLAHRRFQLGLFTPAFMARLERSRPRDLAKSDEADGRAQQAFRDQLAKFGIEAPITNRPTSRE